MPRHFLEIDDLTPAELVDVLDLAESTDLPPALHRRGVALLFEKPSARTRHSMEIATIELGGHPVYVRPQEVGLDVRESTEDVTRTLMGYHAAIAARVFEHSKLGSSVKARMNMSMTEAEGKTTVSVATDADVMGKIGRPLKLIAYDSERNQELRSVGQPSVYRLVRPRTILYLIILSLIGGLMLGMLTFRATLDVNILPERNPLYVQLADGGIRNAYTLRLMNKDLSERSFRLAVTDSEARLSVLGQEGHAAAVTLLAPPDGVETYRVFVQLPRAAVKGEVGDITFTLTDSVTGKTSEFRSVFRGPKR